jgi:hypothetical protein
MIPGSKCALRKMIEDQGHTLTEIEGNGIEYAWDSHLLYFEEEIMLRVRGYIVEGSLNTSQSLEI